MLCCNKCFHVASCRCFILDVAYVSHICCKCMFQMFHLLQTYVAFKCFMLQVFQRVTGAWPGLQGKGRDEPGLADGGRGAPRVLPARRERRSSGGRSGGRGARRDGRGRGTRAWRDEADEEGL